MSFLNWPGGKKQLLTEIHARVPKKFGNYYEPFVGGGAVFFSLRKQGKIFGTATLSDLNNALIETYKAVRDDVDNLIEALKPFEASHSKELYYSTRDKVNRDGWSPAEFVYINRMCFNGLFRVNKAGDYNVSLGSKKKFVAPVEALREASILLQGTELRCCSFDETLASVEAGDFVYLDPPYVPLNSTSFTAYTKEGFDLEMQERVALEVERLRLKGVHGLVSNSSAEWVLHRFEDFTVELVSANRTISCTAAGKAPVNEALISF